MNDIVERITGLPEYLQIFLVAMGNFISEDITIISSSIAYYNNLLTPQVYFLGLFLGILVSDLAMYLVGRALSAGKDSLFGYNISAFKEKAEKYKSQSVFFLIVTRFTPGLRAPSLVAAGIAKFDFWVFCIAKTISIFLLFLLIYLFGSAFVSIVDENKSYIFAFFITLIIITYIFYNFPSFLSSKAERRVFFASFYKYRYFEFWPSFVFYAPMIPIWLWLATKHRSGAAPAYTNPAIRLGGLVGESKNEVNKLVDHRMAYYLRTELIKKSLEEAEKLKVLEKFSFPLILKPDYGQRGKGVFLAKTTEEAENYIKTNKYDIIVQEYSSHQNEVGIFVYKMPDEKEIKLFSVTKKIFPQITGDGVRTVKQLISQDKRAKYCYSIYKRRLGDDKLNQVLTKGDVLNLAFAGNHAQGTEFIDTTEHFAGSKIIDKLSEVFSKNEGGLNVCRFDIRYESDDLLKEGKNFHVIEINGSGAESTNVYDRKFNYFTAYKVIYKQWNLMFKIGKINQKKSDKKISGLDLLKEFYSYKKIEKLYPLSN